MRPRTSSMVPISGGSGIWLGDCAAAAGFADCRPEVHLGFDSLQRSLITTIKEVVDNAIDACEGHDQPDLHIHRDSLPKSPTSH